MKKIIVMVLVVVILASILVMPAMADEIQPRYPVGYCCKCGKAAEYRGVNGGYYQYYCDSCCIWTYYPA